jgi:ABC-type transport system involved in cytochrome c biogenesis ATPase subunit
MKSNIIHVENVIRKFGDSTAVNDLSLDVQEGEIFGFLGHNGAGKTTTVRMLNGVLKANSGFIRVMDLDPVADGPTLRAHTGVLTETAALELRLTARENLIIFADIFGVPREKVSLRVDELLDFFGISEFSDQRVDTFSTGITAIALRIISRSTRKSFSAAGLPTGLGFKAASRVACTRSLIWYSKLREMPYSSANSLARPQPRTPAGDSISIPRKIRVDKSRSLRRYSSIGASYRSDMVLVNQYLARFGGSFQPILLSMFFLTLMCLLIYEPCHPSESKQFIKT